MNKMNLDKADVKTHDGRPAINVKVYTNFIPIVAQVAEHFKCDLAHAQKAVELALESETVQFWEFWQDKTGYFENGLSGSSDDVYFPGHTVEACRSGRSGGWMEVDGLPPIYDWDDVMVGRWHNFAAAVLADMAHRLLPSTLIEDIDINKRHRDSSERFNTVTLATGDRCIAD
jgi:hypothetical protein